MLQWGILSVCVNVMSYDKRCCRNNKEIELQMKGLARDKWEMTSNDVTIYDELGHGAFGKVCKGIMQAPLFMELRESVTITSKKDSKSTITVAVKMLQGMPNDPGVWIKLYCNCSSPYGEHCVSVRCVSGQTT